jgi:hypothetical protein
MGKKSHLLRLFAKSVYEKCDSGREFRENNAMGRQSGRASMKPFALLIFEGARGIPRVLESAGVMTAWPSGLIERK